MTYKLDPDVLHRLARQVIGMPIDGSLLITFLTELLADEYPGLIDIDASPARWVGSKAGGVLGKVRFLYLSSNEYLVIFGSPTGTQGFSGRYKHVDIHKFVLSGKIESYDLESEDTLPLPTLLPGDGTCLERGHARGLTIHPGSWHLEYGRGAIITTVPFAMVDTMLVSLDYESVRRSAKEFARIVSRRIRSRDRHVAR